MDGVPVGKGGMFGVMHDHALLETGNSRIIHNDIGFGTKGFERKPVSLAPHIKRYETT